MTTPAVRALARRRNVTELSAQRPQAGPIPTLGGLAVLAGLAGSIALSLLVYPELAAFLGAALISWRWSVVGTLLIAGLGLIDDVFKVRPITKIVFQAAAALLVVADGHGIGRVINPFTGGTLYVGWLAAPLTLFWIIGITNAFNLIDGLDGLAAGVALIAAVTLSAVAMPAGRPEIALIALALAGALAGFLYYNFSPASIFMGDSGSLFVGYLLAALYVRGAQHVEGVPLLTPLLALSLPIADALLAIIRRGLVQAPNGAPGRRDVSDRLVAIFRRDREHIHHRLISMGFDEAHAVLILYAVSLVTGIVAVLTFQAQNTRLAAAIVFGAIVLFFGARRLRNNSKA
ncbi:MAG TPA: MraY family glycosyltransferase [Verrucomicrobiae bacterium]|nr:MraY family glycosyltransferase [Verrucomicrobiae bacterium]